MGPDSVGGRLVAIQMDGVVGRCMVAVRSENAVTPRPVFDAVASVLPGFESEEAFTF